MRNIRDSKKRIDEKNAGGKVNDNFLLSMGSYDKILSLNKTIFTAIIIVASTSAGSSFLATSL